MPEVQFAQSAFVPIAIGFFGLATGYFIWGGQALFGFPKSTPEVNRSIGMWGFWMPGFMQFITGVYLMVGMTWFGVFAKSAPLYMAALAFTAYGIHWFAMAHRRYIGSSADADGWMAIAFLIISILGVVVFLLDNDIPVAIVFIGLSLIYLTEIPARFASSAAASRTVGLWQVLTGVWLMYMTIATVLNLSVPNLHLWL
ncbi:MAG TPA: hypothetical protein VFU63_11750 [Ktedonobacterales bacterium]|nr:hypothetical protein [Ktedonobacterales bacterium]